jgi:hypothetical protein
MSQQKEPCKAYRYGKQIPKENTKLEAKQKEKRLHDAFCCVVIQIFYALSASCEQNKCG